MRIIKNRLQELAKFRSWHLPGPHASICGRLATKSFPNDFDLLLEARSYEIWRSLSFAPRLNAPRFFGEPLDAKLQCRWRPHIHMESARRSSVASEPQRARNVIAEAIISQCSGDAKKWPDAPSSFSLDHPSLDRAAWLSFFLQIDYT
jgi:hypothetical protein